MPYTREQRGADPLLLLLLLLSLLLSLLPLPRTKSATPPNSRSETCPTLRQDEVGAHRRTSRPSQLSVISCLLYTSDAADD